MRRYKESLQRRLSDIQIPVDALRCKEFQCRHHLDSLREYYSMLICAMTDSADASIPQCGQRRRRAGWNEHVSKWKEEAIFWHRVWVDGGRPRDGWLSVLMRKTRGEYKRRARWVVRNQEKLRAGRMTEALCSNSGRDLWTEIKKIKGKARSQTNVVDDADNDPDICQVFHEKYRDLYQSVPSDDHEIEQLQDELTQGLNDSCRSGHCYSDHAVTVEDFTRAVKKLKRGKSDANAKMSSDHIISACDELYIHLSMFLQSMLFHFDVSEVMSLSVLVPIPKNRKKSLHSSANYRSIAISSVVCKCLDNIIMFKHRNVLSTSELQFGFKSGHSTTQCTYVLNETIDHFVHNDSSVYTILLDASQAFDRVHFVKMFRLLVMRKMCPAMSKLLLFMYISQALVVRWQNEESDSFFVKNGIKQGGVLSPLLFCVYMDCLLNRLQKSGVGCHLGHKFVGALAYADDVTLCAPSRYAAQKLVDICQSFADEYKVKFNSSKTRVLLFNAPRDAQLAKIQLNGDFIDFSDRADHLGHIISCLNAPELNAERIIHDIVYRVNVLHANYNYVDLNVKRTLYRSYCTSYYGFVFWNFSADLNRVHTTWRKCIRKFLNLNRLTHCNLIPFIIDCDLYVDIYRRFCSFWQSCYNSINSVVKFCTKLSNFNFSVIDNNLRSLMHILNIDHIFLSRLLENSNLSTYFCKYISSISNPEAEATAQAIVDLFYMLEGTCDSFFDTIYIPEIINYLCTH